MDTPSASAPQRLVIGISGATGVVYGLHALQLARKIGVETHLVVTPAGQQTRAYETDLTAADLAAMADVTYRPADIVMPPVPAFYLRPTSLHDLVDHTTGRALDLLGLDVPGLPRWGEQDS